MTAETTSTQTAFAAGGKFYDKADLEEKYKSKPDQLQSIFKHAKKIVHPTRKVRDMKRLESGGDDWIGGKGGGI